MASPSGTSSGSTTLLPNFGSECDLQVAMDQKKRKRMQSNRESARRSRMRKQKHLDELMTQVAKLRADNHHLLTTQKITIQQYLALEAENCVLRAQVMELTTRMVSLQEVMSYMDVYKNNSWFVSDDGATQAMSSLLMPRGLASVNQTQPLMCRISNTTDTRD